MNEITAKTTTTDCREGESSLEGTPPIIFGMDIHPMSSTEKRRKSFFALVVLDTASGKLKSKHERITMNQVIRLCWKYRPRYIAMDSLQEVAKDHHELQRLARRLPDETNFVLVTGNPHEGFTKLKTLINRHGIVSVSGNPKSFVGKLSPLTTAEACALLCWSGVGYVVDLFTEEIRVIISRRRRIGPGGWSQQRYSRNLQISVDRVAQAFEATLRARWKEASIDRFDYNFRHVFLISGLKPEDFPEIRKIAKDLQNELAKITVERVPRAKIRFTSLGYIPQKAQSEELPNIIVGIDPGTTTGIAIIDSNGTILNALSKRELGLSQALQIITEHGRPLVVAADVNPVPQTVAKIARKLGARIHTPDTTLPSATEKRQYVDEHIPEALPSRVGRLDNHSRDALFAALKAYFHQQPTLVRIRKVIANEFPELRNHVHEIEFLVIRQGMSVHQAARYIERRQHQIHERQQKAEPVKISLEKESYDSSYVQKLHDQLQMRNQENQALRSEMEELREVIQELKIEINYLKRKLEKQYSSRTRALYQSKRFKELEREINRLKKIIRQQNVRIKQQRSTIKTLKQVSILWEKYQFLPLKILPAFNLPVIDRYKHQIFPNDVILILHPTGGGSKTAYELVKFEIRAILIPEDAPKLSDLAKETFIEHAVPVIRVPLKECQTVNDLLIGTESVTNQNKLIIQYIHGMYLVSRPILDKVVRLEEARLQEILRKRNTDLILLKRQLKATQQLPDDVALPSRVDETVLEELLQEHAKEFLEIYGLDDASDTFGDDDEEE